jgi:hypothetical protein
VNLDQMDLIAAADGLGWHAARVGPSLQGHRGHACSGRDISMTSNWAYNRPDLDKFVVGDLYKHSETDELVEFIGIASGGGFQGEDLAIFRMVPDGGCLSPAKKPRNAVRHSGTLAMLWPTSLSND